MDQLATIQITDTAEHITPGFYTVRCPASYDPAEITAADILNDGLIYIIPDTELEELRARDAIVHARATGKTLFKENDSEEGARAGLTVEEAEEVARDNPLLISLSIPFTETFEVREDDGGGVWLVAVEECVAIHLRWPLDRLRGWAGTDVKRYRGGLIPEDDEAGPLLDDLFPEEDPETLYPAAEASSYRLVATATFDGAEWVWSAEGIPYSPNARAYLEGVVEWEGVDLDRVELARRALDWSRVTLEEIAEATGTTRPALNAYRSGTRTLPAEVAHALASWLRRRSAESLDLADQLARLD